MNTRIRPIQNWSGNTLIAGYRMIAETIPALAQDVPTAEMDSAIMAAARGNSRGRRARHVGYAAIAASIAAMGLTISTSRDPAASRVVKPDDRANSMRMGSQMAPAARPDLSAIASRAYEAVMADATAPLPADPALSRVQHTLQLLPHREARRNDAGLNGLVLGSSPTDTDLLAASEVHTASEIQTPGALTLVGTQYGTVDLNQPEALQRLARENPFHFATIRRILAGVDTVPENTVGRWMKAQFNATDVTYSPVLLTSDPPKKLLAFTLETTHYSALLSLTPDGARLEALRR